MEEAGRRDATLRDEPLVELSLVGLRCPLVATDQEEIVGGEQAQSGEGRSEISGAEMHVAEIGDPKSPIPQSGEQRRGPRHGRQ